MSDIPHCIIHYAFVVSEFTKHQLIAWLSLLTVKNLNLIIEITHNILYNFEIRLTVEQKSSLNKFLDLYKSILSTTVKRDTKYIVIQKNPEAVQLLFKIINNIYGSKL